LAPGSPVAEGSTPDARTDRTVAEALGFLDGGMRGYYASYRGDPVTIRPGDRVYRG
jgi:hypothetical protein